MGTSTHAAAAIVAGATAAGTTVTAVQTPAIGVPISPLSISTGMFATLTNDSKFSSLSLAKDNWPKWKQKILQVLGMSDLDDYILCTIPEPDIAVDPVSYRNWTRNHSKTIAFLQMHVEDSELQFLEGTTEASVAWLALVTRHEKQGPITQVRLIQEALSVSYSEDVTSWPATTDCLHDLCGRIYAQAVPT